MVVVMSVSFGLVKRRAPPLVASGGLGVACSWIF